MSITNTIKRIAVFYDDKGQYLGSKGFSRTASLIRYADRQFNVSHDEATFTKVKRWYWDLEIYHYNINDPNPILLDRKRDPILNSELYDIQLETKVARDLNDLAKKRFNLDWKMLLIIVAVVIAGVYMLTGHKVT